MGKNVLKCLSFIFLVLTLAGCCSGEKDLSRYIDPFIGVKGGAVYAAAACPWGMVTPGPFYGYKKYDTLITGFGHLHLSGTGCGDIWGSIILAPATGKVQTDENFLKSSYSHEYASAGYYSTYLNKHRVKAQMTSTLRTAIHRFTFDADSQFILVDLSRHMNSKFDSSYINIISCSEVEGYVSEGSFCSSSPDIDNIYFIVHFSKSATSTGVWKNDSLIKGLQHLKEKNIGAYLKYNIKPGDSIEARVGISYVSIVNARMNLDKEQNNKSFEQIRHTVHQTWNRYLSRIIVEGKSQDDKKLFYTGLYHMMLHPNVFNDVNGEYRSEGSIWRTAGKHKVLNCKNRTRYTDYSLWDGFRTIHPFLTLVFPEIESDMLQSMVDMYKEDGWLPKFEQAGRETFNMNGSPATPVIADSYLKGIQTFDYQTAYEAMVKEATIADTTHRECNRPGLKQYIQYGGYIPQEYVNVKPPVWGPVSTTLEYNFDDWTIAQMAKKLGKEKDYQTFSQRSLGYRNFYDPQYKLLRPKSKTGEFYSPFHPQWFSMFCDSCPYVEGNAWQYTWFVPHDIQGLIELMGGPAEFTKQLQKCFDSNQYVLNNEPDMAYPYLFNYVNGEQYRTQKLVNELIRKNFNTSREGLPGEDDIGTISGFAVFGMMGFYPDCPASMNYQLTLPMFEKITIMLNQDYYSGKKFEIQTVHHSKEDMFIKSINLNGKLQSSYMLNHNDLVRGGKMIMELGTK